MTDRHTCKIWLAIVLAVLFAAVPILLMETRGFTYETNDDFFISGFISHGSWSPFVSKLLIEPLQMIKTDVNVWTVFSAAIISVGMALTAYVLCRNIEPFRLICLIPLSISAFGLFMRKINFTRTSVCIFVGGASMLLFSLFGRYSKKGERISSFILGIIALGFAALIRDSSALMGLGFLAAFTLAMLIVTAMRIKNKTEVRVLAKKGALMLAAALLCIGFIKINELMKTPEETEFEEFNNARSNVVDYANNYPGYAEAKEEYDRRGISEIDKYLMENWNFTDTELITTEKYEAMGELIQPTAFSIREFAKQILELIKYGSYTLPLALVLLMFFVKDIKTSVIPMGIGAAALLLMYLYLYITGRMILRVTQSAFYITVLLSIVCTVLMESKTETEKKPYRSPDIIAAAALAFAVLLCPKVKKIEPDREEQNLIENQYRYMSLQDDKIFALFDEGGERYVIDPGANMDIDSYDNIILMGGWRSRMPEWYEKIHALGIENPYRALFERDDIYAEYNRIAHRFLNEHYGEISASEVFEMPKELSREKKHYVRYIKHRLSGEIIDGEVESIKEPEPNFDYGRRWKIEGRAENEPGIIYCNAKCGEKELTFAVTVDENNRFTGTFYDVPEELDSKKTEFVFFK